MKQPLLITALTLGLVSLLPAQVDYRHFQSPVRNQAARGTCTAFAVAAAMETFPGVPTDLSEQYIYGAAKLGHYDRSQAMKQPLHAYTEGALLAYYVQVLRDEGAIPEEAEPYDPAKPIWAEDDDTFDKLKADVGHSIISLLRIHPYTWRLQDDLITLKTGRAAADVEWIKRELDQGAHAIPVGYAVNADYWSTFGKSTHPLHPGDFVRVKENGFWVSYDELHQKRPNLNAEIMMGMVEADYVMPSLRADDGHAVAIVGYDDRGFIIKNSWGTDWADGGYGYVSFDYHELFCDEALVIRSIGFRPWGQAGVWDPAGYQLKVTPYLYENQALKMKIDGAELSLVWRGTGAPIPLKEVTYEVMDANGQKVLETKSGYVQGIFQGLGAKLGYPANVLSGAVTETSPAYRVRVTGVGENGQKFTRIYTIRGRQNACYTAN